MARADLNTYHPEGDLGHLEDRDTHDSKAILRGTPAGRHSGSARSLIKEVRFSYAHGVRTHLGPSGCGFSACVVVAALLATAADVEALPNGIAGYAGNLGAACDSCHDGGETPVVRLEGPLQVRSGDRVPYRFVVESRSSEQSVAGFDVAASGGMLDIVEGQGARAIFGEIVHAMPKQNVDGEAAWQFLWTAPELLGPQTLSASGLSANGNGQNTGDAVASLRLVIEVVGPPCVGDCSGDGRVVISELIRGVRIALELDTVGACSAFDRDGDGIVSIDELVAAVQNALLGCGHAQLPTPTPTPTQLPTALPTRTPGMCPTFTPDTNADAVESMTYGGSQSRTFFNAEERRITRETVGLLRPKWRYQTGAVVTASAAVAYVDVAGEGVIKVLFMPSWDGNVYALRASNGTRLWSFAMKPHPGASFPYVGSATVAEVDGEQRVYVPGGMTMYCLTAATGELRWAFDAGTGCTTCDRFTERNQIESSPAVADGVVYFGMDVDDSSPGKGGAFAVDAATGTLVWYFDLETEATCRPDPSDEVRRFDGFHTAPELGLPEGFLATRDGCDFDRAWTECGNIWSSFAVDEERGALFVASANCDTDDDPNTFRPSPPMPDFDAAIFSLDFDGSPRWRWRPRDVDNEDFGFGGVPNLFTTLIDGEERQVVGVGGKDGTYYVLDRDGVNQATGLVEPYWRAQVVPGGAIGGIISSAAVGEDKVQFSTAIGIELANPQRPAAWGLRAESGDVVWSNATAEPSYSATSAIPGVAFMGSLFSGRVIAYHSDTGEVLYRSPFLGGPLASAAVVVDGELFVGAGVGQRGNPTSIAHIQSLTPSPISAFCLPDACDCPTQLCEDGDPCTYDYHDDGGECATEPAPDGIRCTVDDLQGACTQGVCVPQQS